MSNPSTARIYCVTFRDGLWFQCVLQWIHLVLFRPVNASFNSDKTPVSVKYSQRSGTGAKREGVWCALRFFYLLAAGSVETGSLRWWLVASFLNLLVSCMVTMLWGKEFQSLMGLGGGSECEKKSFLEDGRWYARLWVCLRRLAGCKNFPAGMAACLFWIFWSMVSLATTRRLQHTRVSHWRSFSIDVTLVVWL